MMRWAREHRRVVDVLLSCLMLIIAIVPSLIGRDSGGPLLSEQAGLTISVGVLVAGALLFRRRYPVAVFAIVLLCSLISLGFDSKEPGAIGIVPAAYTVAAETNRRLAIIAALVAVVGIGATTMVNEPGAWTGPEPPMVLMAWTLVGSAVGDALRSRRAAVAAAEERARQASLAFDEEARRRVVEERLRLARELHDLVGHHIAVINVQAGLAAHVLREQPDDALEALGHVRRSSRTVLKELGALLSVLRGTTEAETEPLPGLRDLDALMESYDVAGLEIELTIEGRQRRLSPASDLVAYRVLQESLTNARKYGDGRARVFLSYGRKMLTIEIRNRTAGVLSESGNGREHGRHGHGLVGMRERVSAVRGEVETAGPNGDGEFVVKVSLPVESEESE